MKKLISILLCMAMVLSLAAVTFATEENVEVVLGDNVVTIPQSDSEFFRYITFTAEEAGTYVITNTNESGSGLYVYVAPYTYSDGCIGYGESKEVTLEADEEYEFAVYSYYAEYEDTDVAFKIALKGEEPEEPEEPEIPEEPEREVNEVPQEGENYMIVRHDEQSWAKVWVTFTATRTGNYIFTAGDTGYIYIDGWSVYGSEKVYLEEGQEFDFQLYNYDSYEEDAYCSFTITWTEAPVTHNYLQLGENLITWDTGWDYKYLDMTVEQTGVYTVTNNMNDGWSKLWVNDMSSTGCGDSKKVYLEAGQTLSLKLDSDDQEPFALTITYTEGVIEPDGSSDYPYALPMGEVDIDWADYDSVYYVYTATEDGVLTIEGNLTDCNYSVDGGTLVAAGNDVYTMNLRAGTKVTIRLYTYDADVAIALDVAFEAGELQPDGTEEFPFVLELGAFDKTFTGGYSGTICYTYTATESGYLVIKSGLSGGEFSNAIFYGMSKDDVMGYASKFVNAGETIVIELGHYSNPFEVSYEIVFEPGEYIGNGSSSEPFALKEGLTDLYLAPADAYDGYYYTFTAPSAGTWYFAIPEGGYFYSTPSGFTKDGTVAHMELTAGQTIKFNVYGSSNTELSGTIAVYLEGQEPELPEEPEQPEQPETPELQMGLNEVTVSDISNGDMWVFTAPETATYVFTITNDSAFVNIVGCGALFDCYEEVIAELEAGDQLTVFFMEAEEIGLYIAFQEEEPEEPENPDDPAGSYYNPLEITEGEWVIDVPAEDAYDGYWYTFTATEAGTLTITLPAEYNAVLSDLIFGLEYVSDGVYAVEMEAGDYVKVCAWNANNEAISFTAQVSFVGENTEVEPEQPEQPEPDGDMTFVFFAMVVLSMAGMVVLVSKKRSF